MADQVQIRRGTAAQVALFAGAQGELTTATDTNRLQVHDGATLGGHTHALLADLLVTCTDGGTVNTIVVASNIGPAAPVDGMLIAIKVVGTSTGTCTINYNASGAKTLVSGTGATLVPGALQAGGEILAMYRASIPGYVLLARDGGTPQFAVPVAISQGGTGATTAAQAIINLGLTEALVFAGTWNAATNTPAFASGTGTPGAVYTVATAGTTTLDGISQWNVGDRAVFSGISNTWQKIDGVSSEVISVAGRAGAVVVTSADLADFDTAAAAAAPVKTVAGRDGDVTLSIADIADGAALDQYQTFTKTQAATIQPLTYGSTVTIDLEAGNDAAVTLTGPVTFANPSTMPVGTSGHIKIVQDASGGRTASWGSFWRFGAAGTPTLSTAANAIDVLMYWVMDSTHIVACLITGVQ